MITDSCQLFGSLMAVGKKELFNLEVLHFTLLVPMNLLMPQF